MCGGEFVAALIVTAQILYIRDEVAFHLRRSGNKNMIGKTVTRLPVWIITRSANKVEIPTPDESPRAPRWLRPAVASCLFAPRTHPSSISKGYGNIGALSGAVFNETDQNAPLE